MHPVRRAVWVGRFDREPFIALILRVGTSLSLGLLVASVAWCAATNQFWLQPDLQGTNVLQLLAAEIQRVGAGEPWPTFLLHLAIAVLLLIPFARVVASAWYFAYVERHHTYALLTVVVAGVLGYILFVG